MWLVFLCYLGWPVAITGSRKLLIHLSCTDCYWWCYWPCMIFINGVMIMGITLIPLRRYRFRAYPISHRLIGHKRLLNFDAYSFPDVGGWIVIGCRYVGFW